MMEKKYEEPVMGIPYNHSNPPPPPPPTIYAPPQQQYYVGNNPYQSGQIPPNFEDDPKGVPLQQAIYKDIPDAVNCAFFGGSGLTTRDRELQKVTMT
ncbi:hypothetical protein R6Q59_028144 [Mikania micrantha]